MSDRLRYAVSVIGPEAAANPNRYSTDSLQIREANGAWRLENATGLIQACRTEFEAECLRLRWLERLAPKRPGTVIREEFLAPRGLTEDEVAAALGMKARRLKKILDGSTAIDARLARKFAEYFGKPDQYWLRLQQIYDERKWPPRSSIEEGELAILNDESVASVNRYTDEGLRIRFDGVHWRLENFYGLIYEMRTLEQVENARQMHIEQCALLAETIRQVEERKQKALKAPIQRSRDRPT